MAAAGDPANMHGEFEAQVILGTTSFIHPMLVEEFEEEVIIRMYIMNSREFLNFKHGTLAVDNEEVERRRNCTCNTE